MRLIRLVPVQTTIDFLSKRLYAFAFSALMVLGSIAAVGVSGLNFGIDFRGGILIQVETDGPADISGMRQTLGELGLGDVSLQAFGSDDEVLIRIQRQDGGDAAQQAAVATVRAALGDGLTYQRVETVGPTVGAELIQAGTLAVLLAIAAILIYIWFRFEWQYGVCAVLALMHDVIATIGLFAVIQHEFNLSTVAALLTIAGYSINDTVVVFDRVRENFRKYKKLPVVQVLNISVNETLSRTIMTSTTTLLALLALYFLGGAIIRDFAFALIWGVVIGTYSSIFVAVSLLVYVGVGRGRTIAEEEARAEAEGAGSPEAPRA